jgi:uncharacterized protein
MSPPFLLVDGYNLMHAAGLARASYGPGDLARKRHELLVKLARRLTVEERKRCTIVFDAMDAPKNSTRRFRHDELVILFAEPGHDADGVIESLIQQHSAPRHLTVVSSDHRLQTAIRKRRGNSLDSETFLKQIESPHRQISDAKRTNNCTPDTAAGVEFWMEEFQSVSPDEIREELVAETDEPQNDWQSHLNDLQRQLNDSRSLDEWLDDSAGPSPRSR